MLFILHLANHFGIKVTAPQLSETLGIITTLSLGCGGIAYAFFGGVAGLISASLKPFFGYLAAIIAVSTLLYEFPYRPFLIDSGSGWGNPVVILFAGFGLCVIFAVYFWLVWVPIRTWLKSTRPKAAL